MTVVRYIIFWNVEILVSILSTPSQYYQCIIYGLLLQCVVWQPTITICDTLVYLRLLQRASTKISVLCNSLPSSPTGAVTVCNFISFLSPYLERKAFKQRLLATFVSAETRYSTLHSGFGTYNNSSSSTVSNGSNPLLAGGGRLCLSENIDAPKVRAQAKAQPAHFFSCIDHHCKRDTEIQTCYRVDTASAAEPDSGTTAAALTTAVIAVVVAEQAAPNFPNSRGMMIWYSLARGRLLCG